MKILLVLPIIFLFSLVAVQAISVNTISVASHPSYGVYYNGEVYVVSQGARELQTISGGSVVSTVNLPDFPNPFRLTVLDGNIYVIYQKGPLVEMSDGKEVWNYTIPHVGKYPAITSADGYVVVTASYGDKVYFISSSHDVKEVKVVSSPQALAFDNYTNVMYVGAYGSETVCMISMSNFSTVGKLTLNVSSVEAMAFVPPDELAVSPGHHYFELINLTDDKVIAFDSLPVTLGAINGYAWMCYIPYDHDIAMSIPKGSTVVIFNNKGGLVSEVSVGESPNGIVYDPQNHDVYVMNYGPSTVSYFSPPAPHAQAKPIPKANLTPYYEGVGVAVAVLIIIGVVVFLKRR